MARTIPDITEEQKAALQAFRKELLEENIITEEGDTLGTQYDHVLLWVLLEKDILITVLSLN